MRARTEAHGWASIYGTACGLAAVCWQDAALTGRPGWAAGFAASTCVAPVWYFTLQWRELSA